MIPINRQLKIGENELTERFVHSRGPGGQNVNKVATTVQLKFDVDSSPNLPEEVKDRLHRIASGRIDKHGVLMIRARRHRSLERNRREARERLIELIRRAAERQKPRTMRRGESRRAKERRITEKKIRGAKKHLRRDPRPEPE
jgi:ribosome-associated protein